MKKKNGMKVALASTVMLLMASPAFAQKYKVAKVERTRILVDQKWDAQPSGYLFPGIFPGEEIDPKGCQDRQYRK